MLILVVTTPVRGEDVRKEDEKFKNFLEGVNFGYVPFKKERSVTFQDAMSFVISKAIELDSSEHRERLGISRFVEDKNWHYKDCIVFPENLEKVLIVYEDREVSLLEVVVEIAKQAKLDLYMSSAGLVFCKPSQVPELDRHKEKISFGSALYKVEPKD